MQKKLEHRIAAGENVNRNNHLENCLTRSIKGKHIHTHDQAISVLGIGLNKIQHPHTQTRVYAAEGNIRHQEAHSSASHNNQKTSVTTNIKGVNSLWFIHAIKYCTGMRMNQPATYNTGDSRGNVMSS